ncbi:MAG TPA: anion permease [Opitutales bacterium]|nr:anion permease [Opitutales bacterium]
MQALLRTIPLRALIPPVLAGVAAYFMPGMGWAPFLVVLTVALLGVGLWAEYLTALIFFTLAMLLKVAGPDVVFAGFCSSAFWLILAGFFLGQAVTRTGFGARVAGYVARVVPDGYAWALFGTASMSVAMSFLMPSAMGRVLLMLPIIQNLAKKLGFEEGSRGYTGVVFTGLLTTFVPAMSILPANIPNMVLVGAAEAVGLTRPDYAHYLLLHFPVLGFLKAALITVVVGLIFRPKAEESAGIAARRAASAEAISSGWTSPELRLGLVLFTCLLMWAGDSIHGISPAWVGMVGAIVCLLPGIGVLDAQKAVRELNISSLLYVAAIISIGAMVSATGMGQRLADGLLSILPLSPQAPFCNFMVLGLLATFLGPVTTQPGIAAVLTPLTTHLAAASALPVNAVMMTQVLGFSTLLFPFQTAPLLVGLHVLNFPIGKAAKILFILAPLSILLLWPLEYLEWRLIGFLP